MNSQRGFTITELLVTIVVFAILIPVFGGLINTIASLNDQARDRATINAFVENKVESLRSVSFTGLTNGTVDFTNELPESIAAPRSATYVVSSVNPAIKQVDVVVTYTDKSGPSSLEYRTYVGELGVGQY